MTVMKKKFMYASFILSGLLMIFSCTQDPIFFKISKEVPPVKPRIPGHPTKMVEFKWDGTNPVMFVASGDSLHWYNGSSWDSGLNGISQKPGGRIIDIAATSDCLYALCLYDSENKATTSVLKRNSGGGWSDITINNSSQYRFIETIYADPSNTKLFAGASIAMTENYGILYLDDKNDTALKQLKENTGLLSGVAFDSSYYLCTKGKKVFKVTGSTPTVTEIGDGKSEFMGMVKLASPTTIIVVERGVDSDGGMRGTLYKINSSGQLESTGKSIGNYATGALAVWKNPNNLTEIILTAGKQEDLYTSSTSSYTNGYVEFKINSGTLDSRIDPPSITVHDSDRYTSTIGKHVINHMYQFDGVFFASTQKDGLWSYRDRKEGWQWNAEGSE